MGFDELTNKIEAMIQHYEIMKRDTEQFDARLKKKEHEALEVKTELAKVLKERDKIKQKLGSIIAKVDDLGLI
jgi:chromosome segregation ATPase